MPDPIPLPIEGTLDLHTFRPDEAIAATDAFLEESRRLGWKQVRIVHGKGAGTLREHIHAYLRESSHVTGFRIGDETSGGWGATLVALKLSF